jgi:hypothetical protein
VGRREDELARSHDAERRSNFAVGLIQTESIRSANFATHVRPKNQSAPTIVANLPLLQRRVKSSRDQSPRIGEPR